MLVKIKIGLNCEFVNQLFGLKLGFVNYSEIWALVLKNKSPHQRAFFILYFVLLRSAPHLSQNLFLQHRLAQI